MYFQAIPHYDWIMILVSRCPIAHAPLHDMDTTGLSELYFAYCLPLVWHGLAMADLSLHLTDTCRWDSATLRSPLGFPLANWHAHGVRNSYLNEQLIEIVGLVFIRPLSASLRPVLKQADGRGGFAIGATKATLLLRRWDLELKTRH